jgi:dCTP deaminase
MIQNDRWIKSQRTLVEPAMSALHRKRYDNSPVISFGVSSYGYDLRLSPDDFRVFRHIPGTIVDPKKFNPDNLVSVPLQQDGEDVYFILPANTYALGVALERVTMPANVTAICVGKSTYARCGVIANVTPIEAGWSGYITIEVSNSSNADVRIYANEGIVQLLFFEGEPCGTSYDDRAGKYQNQKAEVTLARV